MVAKRHETLTRHFDEVIKRHRCNESQQDFQSTKLNMLPEQSYIDRRDQPIRNSKKKVMPKIERMRNHTGVIDKRVAYTLIADSVVELLHQDTGDQDAFADANSVIAKRKVEAAGGIPTG
jgi:hypothetical protein